MPSSSPKTLPPADLDPSTLSPEERRWLHDKYERMAAEEGQLSGGRTSYFAAIGSILVTGFLYVVVNLLTHRLLQAILVTFLGVVGVIISLVWAVLLRRTNSAQRLWRNSALQLEAGVPPIEPTLPATVPIRGHRELSIDLARPYQSHDRRFALGSQISWFDRRDPDRLTEILPYAFLVIWTLIIIVIWIALFINGGGLTGTPGGDLP